MMRLCLCHGAFFCVVWGVSFFFSILLVVAALLISFSRLSLVVYTIYTIFLFRLLFPARQSPK